MQNIFIKSAPPDPWWVKLGDLGLSKRIEGIAGRSTVRATLGFVPPELYGLIRDENPRRVNPVYADIWCLGETVSRVLTNRETFDSYAKLGDYVDRRLSFPEEALVAADTSKAGIAFIQSIMAPFPLERMTAEQALKHPWILLDEDTRSECSSTTSARDSTEVPSICSGQDEAITQPSVVWTTDSEVVEFGTLSNIPVMVRKLDRDTILHEEKPLPWESTRTIRVACRGKSRAEDDSEDSSTDGCGAIITHSVVAMPAGPEDARRAVVGSRFNGKEVEGRSPAGSHDKRDIIAELLVSSSATKYAPPSQRHLNSVTKYQSDFPRRRPAPPTHGPLPTLVDEETRVLFHSRDTYQCPMQWESMKKQILEYMEGWKEIKPRPRKSLRSKGLFKLFRSSPQPDSDPRRHARYEEALHFLSAVENSNDTQSFTWMPAALLSKRLLDEFLGYNSNLYPVSRKFSQLWHSLQESVADLRTIKNDHIALGRHLSKKEMIGILRLSMEYREGLLSKRDIFAVLRRSEEYHAGHPDLDTSSNSIEDTLPRPQFHSTVDEDVWVLSMVCREWCKSTFTRGIERRSVISQG